RAVGVVELSAGAEGREDDLDGRDIFSWVNADRNSAAVVYDGAASVGIDLHKDRFAEPGERFIDRVIDDFVDQMMQPARVVSADVHARARAYVLYVVEHLDHVFRIRTADVGGDLLRFFWGRNSSRR